MNEFLYKSIEDSQSTIRAIDTKLGFVLIIILTPLFSFSKIYSVYYSLSSEAIYVFFSFIAFCSWILSLTTAFTALIAIQSPTRMIKDLDEYSSFYDGDIFRFGFLDSFLNIPTKPNKNLEAIIKQLPCDNNEIIKILSLEKMKLAYIRDIKIYRSSICLRFVPFWLCLGGSLWFLSLLVK